MRIRGAGRCRWPWRTSPNSPKVACAARLRTRPNAATSQRTGRPAVAEHHFVALGRAGPGCRPSPERMRPTRFFTGACRRWCRAPRPRQSSGPRSGRGGCGPGPDPKRPSAGRRSFGISIFVAVTFDILRRARSRPGTGPSCDERTRALARGPDASLKRTWSLTEHGREHGPIGDPPAPHPDRR